MQQYFQINCFDDKGVFKSAELERMIELGRRHFFIFFPRVSHLEDVSDMTEFLESHPDTRFCIHDKNLLHPDNETTLGRNMAFYAILNRRHPYIESVSYHLGSLFGFGISKQAEIIGSLQKFKLDKTLDRERFFAATYTAEERQAFIEKCFEYIGPMVQVAKESGFEILIKNLCLDYVLTDQNNQGYFRKRGYVVDDNLPGPIPLLLEKGDFPRHPRELLALAKSYGVGISLDMEYFRNLVLLSKKYNLKNAETLERWKIKIKPEHEAMVAELGFFIEPGKPVFYEHEIDLYDQVFFLDRHVEIAHLSGSIGPVFLDKKDLTDRDVTTEMLLGVLSERDAPHAVVGKKQISAIDGFDDKSKQRNFTSDAAQTIWGESFKRQFSEDIFLLKEIGCGRVIQKMKGFSEKAAQTFEMFNVLTDLEFSEEE
ncbi:MAG: hypothetical protein JNM63_01305 [Spirochaetia bacterium]|nr:hypothetical protein [Spirochaetia bacterium]